MRRLTLTLALLAAFSFGLNLPAHAENAGGKKRGPAHAGSDGAQLDELKKKLSEKLRNAEARRVLITDVRGNPVTPEELFSRPESYRDGLQVVIGDEKLEVRGELLESGKKGVKLYVTHLGAGNRIVNGQVITIAPGMTKQAVQKRFEDSLESFMLFKDQAAQKPGVEKRGVASKGSGSVNWVGCLLTFGIAVSTVALLIAAARPGSGSFLPGALVALMTGSIGYLLGKEVCFGTDGDVFSGP